MKVYVVLSDCLDFDIDKIFIDKSKAEEYANFFYISDRNYEIEEWETSDDEIEIDKYKKETIK